MIDYFVGGLSKKIHGELVRVTGNVMFSAHFHPARDGLNGQDLSKINLFLDSGAFQRFKDNQRISNEESLELQLLREHQLSTVAYALASNDRLIDEKEIFGKKTKQRWTLEEGWLAVKQTVAAAEYLAAQRQFLKGRICVLGCQGVDAAQYATCVQEVLQVATSEDWLGLGGWCILGKQQKWMPTFRQTLIKIFPLIAKSPVKHIHIYGVMFEPALGNLLWMCDRYGLTCSTDSKKPLSDCRWKTPEQRKKAGARFDNYKDNLNYWKDNLFNFRLTPYYQSPYAGSVSVYRAKKNEFQLALGLECHEASGNSARENPDFLYA